jgi:hypothetical protein
LWLSACALLQRPLPEFPLAAPNKVSAREFQQSIAVEYRQQHFQLLVAGHISAEAVELAALTPEGVSLFTLRYDGEHMDVRYQLAAADSVRKQQLPPAAIVADLQLVYWPVAALNERGGKHWQVRETATQRELLLDGKPVERATYSGADPWSSPVQLEHLRYGYHLTITTLTQTLLP